MAVATAEDRAESSDPLTELDQLVTCLAACVDPLRTNFLEPYAKAEEDWNGTHRLARQSLTPMMSSIRRWFRDRLPQDFHLRAEEALVAAERAVREFLACSIPQPTGPIGWHEDQDGKRHTPVGGIGPAHREAFARLQLASDTAMQAVNSLARLKDWMPPADVEKGKGKSNLTSGKEKKQSTEKGDGRAKIISKLTQHHMYDNGSCQNTEPINNNELARKAEVLPRQQSSSLIPHGYNMSA